MAFASEVGVDGAAGEEPDPPPQPLSARIRAAPMNRVARYRRLMVSDSIIIKVALFASIIIICNGYYMFISITTDIEKISVTAFFLM